MNRAFLIILAPALLMTAAYFGFGWGFTISLPAGLAALVVIRGKFLFRRFCVRHETRQRSPESNE